jgi:polyhydroxyalkanoate synthase
MYLENKLREPGALTTAGVPIDLGRIDAPAFVYGSKEDHIVPPSAAFKSLALLNPGQPSRNRFVLGASGHIAGVINPASKNKRSYWTSEATPAQFGEWLAGATEHKGSWWGEWAAFLREHGGDSVPARTQLGNARFAPIEAAPGSYVKVRAE